MLKMMFFMLCFLIPLNIKMLANEIDYRQCKALEDIIEIETKEIAITCFSQHQELAELYVSRGESYLLNEEYEKAIEDFHTANFHVLHCHNPEAALVIAFRVAFGEVVCYDNLGMDSQTQLSLERLQNIALYVGCNDCIERSPCQGAIKRVSSRFQVPNKKKLVKTYSHFDRQIMLCNFDDMKQEGQDNYSDILGPDKPPSTNWCEEVVVGVAAAMEVIAAMAPNWAVRSALIGVLEALKHRGIQCCQAGGFWKACVAPITRKWREWKNNKSKNILPNPQNLYLFVN